MIPPRFASCAAAVAAIAALALPTASMAARKPSAQGKKAAPQYLVSLGDSYATGYQPNPADGSLGRSTEAGFVYQTIPLAARRGWKLRLAQFGCGGATSVSVLNTKGCIKAALGIGGRPYDDKTQIQAAEQFLKRNRAKTGLITVSIGGNDVTACARAPNPTTCVAETSPRLRANVKTLVRRLRRAAGPKVRIVGTTYPDVILGAYLLGTPAARDLAFLSTIAFRTIINPTLKEEYEAVRGQLVDVTDATGAYTPLAETTTVAPFGTIPVAVAKVCELTWYCQYQDIHAKASGYKIIAELVARTLPKNKQGK
jgi:lysophospholipase L1-like esterase